MKTIKPKKLQKGDTIGILAISGKINDFKNIKKSKNFFEEQGYNVVISKTCNTSHRYMAGISDDDCVNELHNFFENKGIDAIVCARGGYGTLRLINKIDWDIIKSNPKIFAGYSDITVLLNMIYKKTGLISFHSAMPNGDFANAIETYTKESFFNCLTGNLKEIKSTGKTFFEGEAKGKIWGGNLSTLTSLCGIDFIPDEDLILILEDLNEPTYKIDKMLTQLFNIEKIRQNVKGIALGEFKDCNKNELNEIIKELANQIKFPILDGFKITHNKIKDTIPIGVTAELNTYNKTLKFMEDSLL